MLRETTVAKLNFGLPINFADEFHRGKKLARNLFRYAHLEDEENGTSVAPCNYAFASEPR